MNAHTAYTLRRAADSARDWTDKRDALVVAARGEGASLREIAELVGLTHPTVARICRDAGRAVSA